MNKKIVKKYMLSYLFAGLIPVLILTVVFYVIYSVAMNNEVANNNYAAQIQFINRIDYLTEKMNSVSYDLMNYISAETDGSDLRNENLLNESVLSQKLFAYEEQLGGIAELILYERGETYLYTSNGKVQYNTYEGRFENNISLVMSSFYTTINSCRRDTSIAIWNYGQQRQSYQGMAFVFPLPQMDSCPSATLIFVLKEKHISSLINNYIGEFTGNLYIYNEYLKSIYTNETIVFSDEAAEEIANRKGSGISEVKLDKEKYITMRYSSQNSGISCVIVMPKTNFYSRLNTAMDIILGASITLLIFGFVQSIIFTRRNYKPIKKLIGKIPKNTPYSGDEFNDISIYLESIENKNSLMLSEINFQRPMVKDSCLLNLLQGKYKTHEEAQLALKCANIALSLENMFAMVIESKNATKTIIYDKLQFMEKVFLNYGSVYVVEMILRNRLCIIVNYSADKGDIRRKLADEIIDKTQCKVRIGIGRIYNGIPKLQISFREAVAVLTDYLPVHEQDVAGYEELLNNETQNTQIPVIENSLYISSVKKGDFTTALIAIEEMFEKISLSSSFQITQCLCYEIVSMIVKTANQIGQSFTNDEIKHLCDYSDIFSFKDRVVELTDKTCQYYSEFMSDSNNMLKNNLLNYVNDHFSDYDISLNNIAADMSISTSYLSRFFKQEIGCNFMQYLTMLRMDKAKSMLAKTDIPIKDIIQEVGYLDAPSFVRKFKIYEGMTPSQYREKMK